MGFTDDISVLWTKESCKAEPGHCTLTVREAGSPFALMEDIFADTTQTELSAETYRQVNYVNDINRANAQVLMEYATNGSIGTSITAYGYGIQRESYSMMETAKTAGNTMESVTTRTSGNYCYTGTGSVANLISSMGNRSYTYTPNGQMSEYAMDSPGGGSMTGEGNTADIGNNSSYGTYGVYSHNGEYTHTDLGLQYLRARYYNMTTGTFTSKDTYAGTLTDILSQNRYTYAENNPVTYADPSGHFSIKNAWNKVKAGASAVRTVAKAAVSTVSSVVKKTYNAGALIAGDVIDSISGTCITAKHGNTASSRMAGSSLAAKSRTISRIGVTAGNFNNYMREQQNAAAEMENFKNFLNLGYGLNFERIAKTLPGTTPWAESIAAAVEQKKCQAYNYCVNVKQNMISERVDAGLGLLIKSWCEAVGGATLFVIGSVTWETGVGAVGMPLGLFGLASAISDASQAVQEIEYGLTGNKTAVSTNFLRDSLFKGNAKAYNNITNAVGGAGILAFTATYPILAGTTVILHGVAGQSSGEVPEVTPLLENSAGNEFENGSGSYSLLPGEGDIGTYRDLLDAGEIGDSITPHHMPSAEYMSQYGVGKKDGLCMNMEMPSPGTGRRHRLTDTYGRNMTDEEKAYYYSLSSRDALAYDIANMREIYQSQGLYSEIRPQLQEYIKQYKELMPELFDK